MRIVVIARGGMDVEMGFDTQEIELDSTDQLSEAVKAANIPQDALVSVNDAIIHKDAWTTHALKDGDEIVVLPPIVGG